MEITNSVTDVNRNSSIPKVFKLFQNYPNPFNPDSRINYNLPEKSRIEINLYNALGEKIRSIMSSVIEAGNHSSIIRGGDLSSGIYFCEMKAKSLISNKNYRSTIKTIILK